MCNSAKNLAQLIIEREMTATKAVESCLERIDCYNSRINAVVTLNKKSALNTAKKLDDNDVNREDENLPLFGVPITIKDSFETAGIRTTSSHKPLKNYIPTTDATVVKRLKKAGAIILGKTNLPELAADIQCCSPLFGRTNNPWNPALTSGGSSGGSAAAVAMNFSFLDIGSDLAGSIRIPAAYCGVAGLKATENCIPRTGHIPHLPTTERSVRHLLSFGVLARCVDDLQLGLNIIAGPDGVDTTIPPLTASTMVSGSQTSHSLRVAWWDDFSGVPICSRTKLGLASTVQKLTDAGVQVKRCSPNGFDFEEAWYAFGIIMGAEVGLGISTMGRLPLSWMSGLLPKSQPISRAFAKGMSFNWRQYNSALNIRDRLILELESFLDDWDVWICPVTPTVAFPHIKPRKFGLPPKIMVDDFPMPYLEGTMSMTVPFSLTGSPVVTIPSDIVNNLPVGIQLIGKRWHDGVLLDSCRKIESIIGGVKLPPKDEYC